MFCGVIPSFTKYDIRFLSSFKRSSEKATRLRISTAFLVSLFETLYCVVGKFEKYFLLVICWPPIGIGVVEHLIEGITDTLDGLFTKLEQFAVSEFIQRTVDHLSN